jgi:amylosucrase
MDWAAAARRTDRGTLEGRVFGWLQRLGEVRGELPALRGGGEVRILDVGNDAVLAWERRHPRSGRFIGLANFSSAVQTVDADTVTGYGTFEPVLSSDGRPDLRADRLLVPGLGFAWFAES